MQALKSKGNEGLEATTVQGCATPMTEHSPSKICSSRELHELAETMGKGSAGGQRPALLRWTQRPECFTRAFPAYQVLRCIQTFSHVGAGIDTAYHMLREGGSNLLYCSCQKPLLVYVMKAPERQNIPKTTLLKLATPETPPSCLWMAGLKEASSKSKRRDGEAFTCSAA